MYQTIYDLIMSAFFQGVTVTGWIELVCTVLSTAAIVFCFSVPFIVVIKVIKIICGR